MVHEGSRISVLGGKQICQTYTLISLTWSLWGCTAMHAICTGSCITKHLKDVKGLYEEYIVIVILEF